MRVTGLRTIGVAVTTALVAALAGCAAPKPVAVVPLDIVRTQVPAATQAEALTRFGESLYNELLANPNPVYSPVSVFAALGMAYDGAGGDTAAAFQAVLGMSAAEARATAAYLLTQLTNPGGGTVLTAADSVWLDDTFTAGQDWVNRVAAYYQAEVYNTDLQAPGTVGAVNDWISKATKGLIPRMLDRIDPLAVALLVNALYLKADWAAPFDTADTREGQFTTPAGAQVPAWYMGEDVVVPYIDTPDVQGIVLPYADGRLAFMAVMPASGDLHLAPGTLQTWLKSATTRGVILSIPKFHAEYGPADLSDALITLGLGVAFGTQADFSGISPRDVCISRVLHQVTMDVGEKGTVAAAATTVELKDLMGSIVDGAVLTFDHPYIYAVMDLTTGVPLFLGAVTDTSLIPPTAK